MPCGTTCQTHHTQAMLAMTDVEAAMTIVEQTTVLEMRGEG